MHVLLTLKKPIDFKKVYGVTKVLMWKILKMGIRGNLFKILEDMYDGGIPVSKLMVNYLIFSNVKLVSDKGMY